MEFDFAIMQGDKPLKESLYTIDIENKIFSSYENYLTFLFGCIDGWTFNTGSMCTFDTGYECTFNTGYNCTFHTGSNCTFKTGECCTFRTASNCTFRTANYCMFKTGSNCTFKTGAYCTFLLCNINTCKFKKWDDISIILDYKDNNRYILNKELIKILKVSN